MENENAVKAADTLLHLLITHQSHLIELPQGTSHSAGKAAGERIGDLVSTLREKLIQMYQATPKPY